MRADADAIGNHEARYNSDAESGNGGSYQAIVAHFGLLAAEFGASVEALADLREVLFDNLFRHAGAVVGHADERAVAFFTPRERNFEVLFYAVLHDHPGR